MDNRVWQKDDFFQPRGRKRIDMDPTVVELPEERVPLMWNFDQNSVYGYADNFKLEEGEITCDLNFFNEQEAEHFEALDSNGDTRIGGYYSGLIYTDETESHIESCKLKGVSVVLTANMPGYDK